MVQSYFSFPNFKNPFGKDLNEYLAIIIHSDEFDLQLNFIKPIIKNLIVLAKNNPFI